MLTSNKFASQIDFLVGTDEQTLNQMWSGSLAYVLKNGNVPMQGITTRDLSVTFNITEGWTPMETIRACRFALQKMYANKGGANPYGTDLIHQHIKYVW